MSSIVPYKALALQTACQSVNTCTVPEARTAMHSAITRIGRQISASKAFIGNDLHLVVLPEYFLTGFPMGETPAEWKAKACISTDGEEYAALSTIAQTNKIYLSGNVYENDAHFTQLYFQTSFIIAPSGDIILRYRRLNSMFAPTPHDVLGEYIAVYGRESLFPVAKTPIGNLACIASEEILYPEIARCLALQGAEIFLHSSSEIGSPLLTPKNIAKLARATENMCYVVSANSAGINGYAIPAASTDGHSQIVHYEGHKLAEAGYGESMVANATLHPDALRQHRSRPGMSHFLSRQRLELFAETYSGSIYPPDTLSASAPGSGHYTQTQIAVIERLKQKGIIE
jgi:deaminated glutathione amidase